MCDCLHIALMTNNIFLKIILFPFSLIYGTVIVIRELLYKADLLRGVSFDIPVISVGNLSVGGTGKTPHIEFLIRLLSPYIQIGTLSRGYKRKTSGYRVVNEFDSSLDAGDEPLQIKRKFKDVFVAVCENRVFAIPKMLITKPDLQTILLDDAFQHRQIIPGLNILLTQHSRPFFKDFLLPSGSLREFPESYKRADVIIVTKCPDKLSLDDAEKFTKSLRPFSHQKVFFSKFKYRRPYFWFNPSFSYNLKEDTDVLLISAIANSDYLVDFLHANVNSIEMLEFRDHHYFKEEDMRAIHSLFRSMKSENKIILTTEKDAGRLELFRSFFIENQLPLVVLPVEVEFCLDQQAEFEQCIKDYLLSFKR